MRLNWLTLILAAFYAGVVVGQESPFAKLPESVAQNASVEDCRMAIQVVIGTEEFMVVDYKVKTLKKEDQTSFLYENPQNIKSYWYRVECNKETQLEFFLRKVNAQDVSVLVYESPGYRDFCSELESGNMVPIRAMYVEDITDGKEIGIAGETGDYSTKDKWKKLWLESPVQNAIKADKGSVYYINLYSSTPSFEHELHFQNSDLVVKVKKFTPKPEKNTEKKSTAKQENNLSDFLSGNYSSKGEERTYSDVAFFGQDMEEQTIGINDIEIAQSKKSTDNLDLPIFLPDAAESENNNSSKASSTQSKTNLAQSKTTDAVLDNKPKDNTAVKSNAAVIPEMVQGPCLMGQLMVGKGDKKLNKKVKLLITDVNNEQSPIQFITTNDKGAFLVAEWPKMEEAVIAFNADNDKLNVLDAPYIVGEIKGECVQKNFKIYGNLKKSNTEFEIKFIPIVDFQQKSQETLLELSEVDFSDPNAYQSALKEFGHLEMEGIVYRVQIGAYKNPANFNREKANKDNLLSLYSYALEDGLTRFSVGKFSKLTDAELYKRSVIEKGYADAFLILFRDNERQFDLK